MIRYLFLLLFLILSGCNPEDENLYHFHNYQNQFPTRYEVDATTITKSGIHIDMSGLSLPLDDIIDRQTLEVEICLQEQFGNPPVITPDPKCDSTTFPLPIHRDWLVVKVAPDAVLSQDGSQEMLPALAPIEGCIEKGLCKVGEPCNCHYRAGIQDDVVIVITPSGYLYKDPLIRMVTGCNNPWVGKLAICARPSVPMLSGLVK